ncbi:hypothetical protein Taro_012194 [Colocasia esculenta]|uniref:2-C-methyl-D-erythritol 4-phosphate cytidylyltransferase n=1 Tax=Colocasia esculenta TaxID=4460 RepID=A0A843U812_COLES|nr:hypothetical protein [Colocasia esculenta]
MHSMALLPLHPRLPCRPSISVSEGGPLSSLFSAKRFLPGTLRAQGGRTEGKKTVALKGVRCAGGRSPSEESGGGVAVKDKSVSVILLSGGKGKRMGASMPKQYLPLLGQPIALYSFCTFSRMNEVKEVIVVCDPLYMDVFQDALESHVNLKFALPGKERQDSVFSGFQGSEPPHPPLLTTHPAAANAAAVRSRCTSLTAAAVASLLTLCFSLWLVTLFQSFFLPVSGSPSLCWPIGGEAPPAGLLSSSWLLHPFFFICTIIDHYLLRH